MIVLAQGLTEESSTAKHTVGQIYDSPTGARYVYCVDSGSGNAAYKPVTITPGTFATTTLTKANADKGYKIAVPQIAVTASYYYWAMIRNGSTTAYVLAKSATASEATLFTTATAGLLDDLATSQTGIGGIRLTATAATAAASAVTACMIDDPEPFSVETAFDVAESMADSAALLATEAQTASNATSVASISVAASNAGASVATISTYAANVAAASNATSVASISVAASNAGASVATLSGVSAGSMATSVGRWGLVFSTMASVLSAGSILDSAASVAKASYATEGDALSHIVSAAKSAYA